MPDLLPDERERARRRHSLIVLVAPPHRVVTIALLVLLVLSVVRPDPVAWVLAVVVAVIVGWRWLNWRAEWVLLTDKRIIRMQGLPETTQVEAFLRVDRISGVVLVQTLMGRLCGYGTIHLEASGSHPALRHLERVADVAPFYLQLRDAVFGTRAIDPDEEPSDFETAPLPVLPPPPHRPGSRDRR